VGEVADFIGRFVVVPPEDRLVVASWVIASHMMDSWDRFPHLAITSPEKRCGKTRFLQLLELLVPNPVNSSNISPASIYRLIEANRPTLLLDEAQSLSRRGSESSETIREIFCAGIDQKSQTMRVGGPSHEVQKFSIYSPKIVALIGSLDGVLADRCIQVGLVRKTSQDNVERFRSRIVEPLGIELRERITEWVKENQSEVQKQYDHLEPFENLENDRMAELLLPMQAVVTVCCPECLPVLEQYATNKEAQEYEQERLSPGVLMLQACHEVFHRRGPDKPLPFVSTASLIDALVKREEEPWANYRFGKPITPESLGHLLRPYGIHSEREGRTSPRGYRIESFLPVWGRYLAIG